MNDLKSSLVECDYAALEQRVLASLPQPQLAAPAPTTGRRDKALRFVLAYGPNAKD